MNCSHCLQIVFVHKLCFIVPGYCMQGDGPMPAAPQRVSTRARKQRVHRDFVTMGSDSDDGSSDRGSGSEDEPSTSGDSGSDSDSEYCVLGGWPWRPAAGVDSSVVTWFRDRWQQPNGGALQLLSSLQDAARDPVQAIAALAAGAAAHTAAADGQHGTSNAAAGQAGAGRGRVRGAARGRGIGGGRRRGSTSEGAAHKRPRQERDSGSSDQQRRTSKRLRRDRKRPLQGVS